MYSGTLGTQDAGSFGGFMRRIGRGVKRAARAAARSGVLDVAVSAVPGGSLARGAITAGSALAQGKRLDRALLAGAGQAVPGGALGRAALQAGMAAARGQRLDRALLAGAQQLPGGALTRAAVNVGQDALRRGNRPRPGDNRRPVVIGRGLAPMGLSRLPAGAQMVGAALIRDPALRGLTAARLAQRFGTSPSLAARGIASVVEALQRGTPDPRGLPVPSAELTRRAMTAPLLRLMPAAGRASWAPSPDAGSLSLTDAGWRYTVESGDLPYLVAQQAGGTLAQLIAANPQKAVANGTFKTFGAGEVLNWPPGWPVPDDDTGTSNAPVEALADEEAAILRELMGLYAQRAQLGQAIEAANAAGDFDASAALNQQRTALSSGPIRELEARLARVRAQLGAASLLSGGDPLPDPAELPVLDREIPPPPAVETVDVMPGEPPYEDDESDELPAAPPDPTPAPAPAPAPSTTPRTVTAQPFTSSGATTPARYASDTDRASLAGDAVPGTGADAGPGLGGLFLALGAGYLLTGGKL